MSVSAGQVFASNVAPPKILRPKPEAWACLCSAACPDGGRVLVSQVNPGYLARCNGCGARRPR